MTLACAAEMVAPIANMLEAALALRSLVNDSVTTTTVPPVCGGADDRADQGEGPHAVRRIEITTSHRSRLAIIYVRQSTLAQVRGNTESTARQYGLAGDAARMGWAASAIEVIDADLGISGRSADNRAGFKEIVARVCLGGGGAIFGLEVSRLARSNAD